MNVSPARKWLVALLAVAASLSVVLAAIWVSAGRGRPPGATVARTPRGTPPNVIFAPGVTSGNRQVDAFVDKFIGLCRRGEYEQYRLCWTAYGTPVSGDRFAAMWKFARKVTITEIVPVPDSVKAMHPAYVIRGIAELDLKGTAATRPVEVMVQWEENRWAVAPAPRLTPEPQATSVTETAPASRPAGPTVQHG